MVWRFFMFALLWQSLVGLYSVTFAQKTNSHSNPDFGFQQLFGDDLLEVFSDNTFEAVYGPGSNHEGVNGKPASFTEVHYPNSRTDYDHRGVENFKTEGIYRIQKDQMCFTYFEPDFFNGTSCFYIFERQGCYYHYDADLDIPEKNEEWADWVYVASLKNEIYKCQPEIS